MQMCHFQGLVETARLSVLLLALLLVLVVVLSLALVVARLLAREPVGSKCQ